MRDTCKVLRQSLILYAEDELVDPTVARRVRRHLARCGGCRDFLEEYDRGTRELLESYSLESYSLESYSLESYSLDGESGEFDAYAGSYDGFLGSESGRFDEEREARGPSERSERIYASIAPEETPARASSSASVIRLDVPPREESANRSGWARVAMSGAAALALSFVLYLVFSSGGVVEDIEDTGFELVDDSGAPSEEPATHPASVRWVIDDDARLRRRPTTRLASVSDPEPAKIPGRFFRISSPDSAVTIEVRLERPTVAARRSEQLFLLLDSDWDRLHDAAATQRVRRQVWARSKRLSPVFFSRSDERSRRRAIRSVSTRGEVYRIVVVSEARDIDLFHSLAGGPPRGCRPPARFRTASALAESRIARPFDSCLPAS